MLPELFKFGPITISPYGILVTTGFILAIFLAKYNATHRESLDGNLIFDFGVGLALSALVGAKILLIFTEPYFYKNPSHIFSMDFLRSGGVFYGGFIGALFYAIYYIKKHNLPGYKTADCFGSAIPLGHTFGRIGCFTAGCCHGKYCSINFLAVKFTNPHCQVEPSLLGKPIYPTQLMEAAGNFLIFLFLFKLHKKKKFDGQIILLYVILYGTLRFLLEFIRGDQRGWVIENVLSTSQFIALILVPAAIYLYIKRSKKYGLSKK